MGVVQNLLILYAIALLLNVVLSAVLWAKQKTRLHRNLFFVWATMLVSFVAQGAAAQASWLAIVLSFSTSFLVNAAAAYFIARLVELPLRLTPFGVAMGVGIAAAVVASSQNAPFWVMGLPVALPVSAPLLVMCYRALRKRRQMLTTTGFALIITCIAFSLHNIDFAFLRDKPGAESFGFTVAILIIFALSITMTAVVLERVAAERTKFVQLDEAKNRFFAHITHELRTPMTMILAPVEDLIGGEVGELLPQQKAYLHPVRRNGLRLLKLINNLLDLARLDDGQLRLTVSRVDLEGLLEDIRIRADGLAQRNNIKFTMDVQACPDLYGDRDLLERVVINLVANALKFTQYGGKLTLRARVDDKSVVIEVEDNGPGIPADKLHTIFQRFSQVDHSVSRQFGGSGIGLALAKEIAELHHGSIEVRSELKKGSTFRVLLNRGSAHFSPDEISEEAPEEHFKPTAWTRKVQEAPEYKFLEIEDAAERRRVPRADESREGASVLVVEDNPSVMMLIHSQLAPYVQVHVAENGEEGLRVAQARRPDVIVSDYAMPVMDGVTMVREIRRNSELASTPIIMLTAKGETTDRIEAREAGADVYLNKPFSPRELREAIFQLLEKKGQHITDIVRTQVESLETISASLSHEIHNPLTYIRNAMAVIREKTAAITEIAREAGVDGDNAVILEKSFQRIERMESVADRGVSRIQEITDLLRRMSREGLSNDAELLELDEVIGQSTRLVSPKDGRDVEVEYGLNAAGMKVSAIPTELHQVFRNLLQNAMDAGATRISVTSDHLGDTLRVIVKDNGPGIPAEIRDKIFTPFFTTKGPGKGMGLGLTITHQFIAGMGGKLEVSCPEDGGTRMTVTLPLASSEKSGTTAASA